MSKSGFDYSQFEKFNEKLQELDFHNFIYQFLGEMALRVIAKTKPRTPVDTGFLRNAWQVGDIRIDGNVFEVDIVNNAEYATYVEYGHTLRNGAWKDGYFMVTISIDEVQQQIPKRFEQEFMQYLKNKGVG